MVAILLLCLFRFSRLLGSGHQTIAVENIALRLQLAAFQRKRKRPVLTQWDCSGQHCLKSGAVGGARWYFFSPTRLSGGSENDSEDSGRACLNPSLVTEEGKASPARFDS